MDKVSKLDRVREILQQHDLKVIGQSREREEYTAEAGRILLRLRNAESVEDIERLLQDVFSIPGVDPARMDSGLKEMAVAMQQACTESDLASYSDSQKEAEPETKTQTPVKKTKKTVHQLVEESASRHVTQEEFSAAREYERSLIPADAIMPTQGQCYRCTGSLEVTAILIYSMPGSASQPCTLTAGLEVIIDEMIEPRPINISFLPKDTESFAASWIPQSDRDHPKYSHFYLTIGTLEFLEHFELCY